MHPILLDFGTISLGSWLIPLKIYTYGTLMALAFLLGIGLAALQARRAGISEEVVYDLGLYALIAGLVGARLFYVLFVAPEYYLEHPAHIFFLNRGGLVFYGGFFLAALAVIGYARRRKLALARIGDLLVPSVALGHAIGRLGCLAYGCCYGRVLPLGTGLGLRFPVDSPAFIDHLGRGLITMGDQCSLPVFPTQLLESGANFLIFAFLFWYSFRKQYEGQLIIYYVLLYAPVRFVLEFFRADDRGGTLLSLSPSQWFSILLFAIIAGIILTKKLGPANPNPKP